MLEGMDKKDEITIKDFDISSIKLAKGYAVVQVEPEDDLELTYLCLTEGQTQQERLDDRSQEVVRPVQFNPESSLGNSSNMQLGNQG
jgi:hypothetical protein